ncbi:MAG TPA: hypothetical protein VFN50_01340 [Acidimicrobiales bacterium]|nr:hypothetical protein [Acidimicrobiales bacterium]
MFTSVLRAPGFRAGASLLASLSFALAGLVAYSGLTTRPAAASVTTGSSYDVVTAAGLVHNAGGAGWYGDERRRHLATSIVGMSVLPDGHGYWLAGLNGAVFPFGTAHFYGSLRSRRLRWRQEIVSIAASPKARGYFLIGRDGTVTSFGDAPRITRLAWQHERRIGPMVAAAVTPSGHGAWLVNARGDVYPVGGATNYGSLAKTAISSPVTAMTRTPDGRGYWIADEKGQVFAFGDAGRVGLKSSPSTPVVSLATASGTGYWAATATGQVFAGGTAPWEGRLPSTSLPAGVRVAAIVPAARPAVRNSVSLAGSVGFDVNWPQCAPRGSLRVGSLPTLSGRSVAVVGVDGWAIGSYNSCLRAEVAWAARASAHYQLYMFINSPASATDGGQSGPDGLCSAKTGSARQHCIAYNYGYNAATRAVAYAASRGAHAQMWWLDVENASCARGEWSRPGSGEWWSCDHWLNAVTINGAMAGLRSRHLTGGVYGTSLQWGAITGHYILSGHVPLWIAGAYWTSPPYPARFHYPGPSANAAFCAGRYNFAGGHPVLLQETPGSNGYPFDPDYAC